MLYLALLPRYEIEEIPENIPKMRDRLSTGIFFLFFLVFFVTFSP